MSADDQTADNLIAGDLTHLVLLLDEIGAVTSASVECSRRGVSCAGGPG